MAYAVTIFEIRVWTGQRFTTQFVVLGPGGDGIHAAGASLAAAIAGWLDGKVLDMSVEEARAQGATEIRVDVEPTDEEGLGLSSEWTIHRLRTEERPDAYVALDSEGRAFTNLAERPDALNSLPVTGLG